MARSTDTLVAHSPSPWGFCRLVARRPGATIVRVEFQVYWDSHFGSELVEADEAAPGWEQEAYRLAWSCYRSLCRRGPASV